MAGAEDKSGSSSSAANTNKHLHSQPDTKAQSDEAVQNAAAKLEEEDDEFEDFPADDWLVEETNLPIDTAHLWEESWDDDDQTLNDEFSAQLKRELEREDAKKT